MLRLVQDVIRVYLANFSLYFTGTVLLIECTFVRLLKKFVLQKYGLKTFFGI
ncbi:hypothetical protein TPHV1_170009 [Treponema phagedenis]|uniref:Uncharacterized protein n=1 Tax=Treponema phagedenis TaxID=162 RepID=A0A0B7GS45_TREPH|nr:hypothetical protein TPHV1_170009 [Treponema phagedenis]